VEVGAGEVGSDEVGAPALVPPNRPVRNASRSSCRIWVVSPTTGGHVTVIDALAHRFRLHRGTASDRNHHEQHRRPADPELLEEIAQWVSANLHGRGASAQD
jgi:hypothetical protein